MMTQNNRHILFFDLDDTLFPEIDFLYSGYRQIAIETSRRKALDESTAYKILIDNTGPAALDTLFSQQNSNGLSISEMLNIYRTHFPSITLSADVSSTLSRLSENKNIAAMGIITDGRIISQTNKINALGLNNYFAPDMILISEAIGGDKLTGIPFRMVEDKIGFDTANLWYIGDNISKDFVYPNSRGWITVMIPPGPTAIHKNDLKQFPQNYHPQFTIPSITQLPTLIETFKRF